MATDKSFEEQIGEIKKVFEELREHFLTERAKQPYGCDSYDETLFRICRRSLANDLLAFYPEAHAFIRDTAKEPISLPPVFKKPSALDLRVEQEISRRRLVGT